MACNTVSFVENHADDDGVYTGRLVNDQRDGVGKYTWPLPPPDAWHVSSPRQAPGHTYDGEWRDGSMHGRGAYRSPDGDVCEGEWHRGARDGWGSQRCSPGEEDGERWEGLWRDGHWVRGTWGRGAVTRSGDWAWSEDLGQHVMQGWGVMRKKAAGTGTGAGMVTVYEGEWHGDKMHGNGTWRSEESGDVYCGEFVQGQKCGVGRMMFGGDNKNVGDGGSKACGGCYSGEWRGDKFHGNGVRLWSNGDRYEGNWDMGKENGKGAKFWARDGSSFVGVWEKGVPQKGTMAWPNGDKFTGIFTQAQGGKYHGEGTLSLSPASGEKSEVFKGILHSNTFQGVEAVGSHQMGSSLPQLGHKRILERAKEGHLKEKNQWSEEKRQLVEKLNMTQRKMEKMSKEILKHEESDLQNVIDGFENNSEFLSKSLCELNSAFKLASQFQSQLKHAAQELLLLDEPVTQLKQCLKVTTEQNEILEGNLRELTTLKETLTNEINESALSCKVLLGQTLTVHSSESEIHQCSRNISMLTKKILEVKPCDREGGTEGLVPSKDTKNLMLLKPWEQIRPEQIPTEQSAPFPLLRSLTDTLLQVQGCTFEECNKVSEDHTRFLKECTAQLVLGGNLRKELEDLLGACQVLNREYQHKYMLKHGLEGEECFLSCPAVWSELPELLPHAQQAIMTIMFAKVTTASSNSSSSSNIESSNNLQPTLPGSTGVSATKPVTESGSGGWKWEGDSCCQGTTVTESNNMQCIVCDERPRNVRFHPCGHGVLCAECASNVRKCPFCRAPIQEKQKLFL
ncbi:morn domain repeat protein [Pelomyxa schiedti]|nr:morn domain repeat protein [Pelomyxa schiedti]